MATIIAVSDFINRSDLVQEDAKPYVIPMTAWRIHDAQQTNVTTAGNDDLGIVSGTLGSAMPKLRSGDAHGASLTQYARCQFMLPVEYVSGETITLRVNAGMSTTVADTTAAIDASVFLDGGGSDIVTTAAQSCNSTDVANFDFTVTPTGVVPGSVLDIRLKAAIVDSATQTGVYLDVNKVTVLLDIQG